MSALPDASLVAFESWADDYALRSEPNYSKETEADCFAAWQASRKQALEEAVDWAEEWALYVTEDNAPETLRTRMERLK